MGINLYSLRSFLRCLICLIRRLIISEQIRRVSLFFPCFISAFSLLSPRVSLGSFSVFAPEISSFQMLVFACLFAQLLSFVKFSKS
jgi:hypothetical protein